MHLWDEEMEITSQALKNSTLILLEEGANTLQNVLNPEKGEIVMNILIFL